MRNIERCTIRKDLKKETAKNSEHRSYTENINETGSISVIESIDGIGNGSNGRAIGRGRSGSKAFVALLLCLIMVIPTLAMLPGSVILTLASPDTAAPDAQVYNYDGLAAAVAGAPDGEEYVIEIESNFDFLSEAITIDAGKNITLVSGDDYTLTVQKNIRHFIVKGTLTLTDGVTLTRGASDGGGVEVNKGTFNMTGGTISNNSAVSKNHGGGVYIYDGNFKMDGGEISGNKARLWGGGVFATYHSTFVFKGGTIEDNTAQFGGGIYITDTSRFEMDKGATITGNKAPQDDDTYGGGVCIMSDSEFMMYGGEISGNSARVGGGVCIRSSSSKTSTMTGGTISGNEALWNGGGVAVELSNFHMIGGDICGNKALGDDYWYEGGGGVFIQEGSFRMDAGTISGNITDYLGGGVMVKAATELGVFTMNDGTISDNQAGCGGGVAVTRGDAEFSKFIMNNGEIVRNEAVSGGGVVLDWGGSFTMKNGAIDGNTATGIEGGGAVMIFNYYVDEFIMVGGRISNNSAPNGDGGGVWTYNPENNYGAKTLTISDQAEFFGNSASRAYNRYLVADPPANILWSGMGKPDSNSVYGTHLLNNYDVSYTPNIPETQVKFCTVTFEDWDGTELKTQSVASGGYATAPKVPDRDGWMFTDWDKEYTNVTVDITVTAQYEKKSEPPVEPPKYAVTFVDWNKEILKTEQVPSGDDATAPEVPDRNGWTFTGWDNDFTNVTEDITVTAMYEKDTDPVDPKPPTEPTDPTDPSEPTEPTDPTDTTDPTEPSDPSDSTKYPKDPTDQTDPTDPPSETGSRPAPPDRPNLVPEGDHYIEFHEDTPTGEWHWDFGGGTWVYYEYPPTSALPQTGAGDMSIFYLVMLCVSITLVAIFAIYIRRFE